MQRLFGTRLFGIYIAFNVACTVTSTGLGHIITILETFPRSITIRILTYAFNFFFHNRNLIIRFPNFFSKF